MGNVCSCLPGSKSNEHISSSNHPFNQPGRTLNSTSQPHKAIGTEQARENMGQSQSTQGPGRTLGGSEEQPQRRETDPQMRSAAARAAEARSQDKKPKGKLGQALDKQQRRTGTDALQDASNQEVGTRRQDEGQVARNWD